MSVRILTRNSVLFRGLVLGALAVTAAGISAVAQPAGGPGAGGPGGGPGGPGGGGGIPPELRAKIEAAEAQTVAASLNLDAEKTGKLAEAYSAARKAAAEKGPDQVARGDWEAMRKIQEENQAKMAETFKGFLDEAQAKEAASVLGGNGRQWDRLVGVVLGFGLDEAKQKEALGHTLAFVKASSKARAESFAAGNPESARTGMMAAKKAMDDAIALLLSDAQKAEWAEKTSRGPRGGGGGERRERGERGEGGAGAPPAPGAEKAPK